MSETKSRPGSRKPTKGKTTTSRGARAGEETTGLRVLNNARDQSTDAIASIPAPTPPRAVPSQVVDNPAPQAEEEISAARSATNAPRLANGFKVVENRAYQRKQKIARAPLTVPADDEMGHKKLFTKFEEAFTTRDIAALRECLSPAFTWKLPNGQVVYGRDAALDEMERRFAMPNGPRFSASVWRFRGNTVLQTYDVEYLGPDGVWRQSQGFDLYEIGDGLITLKDAYWKMIP